MQLTPREIQHVINVEWGLRFWQWFRWVLLCVLVGSLAAQKLGWSGPQRLDWLAAAVVYLLVAWPGLCRAYVFHALQRFIANDPEAQAQLLQARAAASRGK